MRRWASAEWTRTAASAVVGQPFRINDRAEIAQPGGRAQLYVKSQKHITAKRTKASQSARRRADHTCRLQSYTNRQSRALLKYWARCSASISISAGVDRGSLLNRS